MRWCYKCINDHTKNIMPGFRMLSFKLWGGEVHPKTFESLSPLSKILLKIYLNQYIVSKTVPKSCLKIFEINLKIN